tara:strand:+ start:2335 stop:3039 length:705 start_codon:yes stop_codon:yes gene_type:complete
MNAIAKLDYHESTLVGKLMGMKAIGTNTTKNKFCFDRYTQAIIKNEKAGKVVDICGVCYSQKSLNGFRKNNQKALDKNNVFAEKPLTETDLKQIFILQSYYRFDHHGELLTELCDDKGNITKRFDKFTMIENFCRIAEYNPHCNFALWTKRKDIISQFFKTRKKPKNFILVYSNLVVNKVIRKIPLHFDKVFNNVEKDYLIDEQNCTGQKCRECLRCYKFSNEVENNIIIEKVK